MAITNTLLKDVQSVKDFCKWFAVHNLGIEHLEPSEAKQQQFSTVNIERNSIGVPVVDSFVSKARSSYNADKGVMLLQYPDMDEFSLAKSSNDKMALNFTVWFLKKPLDVNSFEERDAAMQYANTLLLQFRGYLKAYINQKEVKHLISVNEKDTNTDPVTKVIDNLCGYAYNISLMVTVMGCMEEQHYKANSI